MEELQRFASATKGKLVLDRVAHAYNTSTWKMWQEDCPELKMGLQTKTYVKEWGGDHLKSNQVSTAAPTPGYNATMKKAIQRINPSASFSFRGEVKVCACVQTSARGKTRCYTLPPTLFETKIYYSSLCTPGYLAPQLLGFLLSRSHLIIAALELYINMLPQPVLQSHGDRNSSPMIVE